ncbi:putative ribonuclease H-like domain-containing protein, partial [Tanacetum coccineum]
MDAEKERTTENIVEEESGAQEERKETVNETVNEPAVKRKKSIPRKTTRKRQKLEVETEKEELKTFLDIVPREEAPIDIESLSTKFPIVDWKTIVLTETHMYYQVFRGDGSSKNYKILSEMLEDFDRMDVEQLFRLVKERYSSTAPQGYDLMLWGDLHTLFEPDKDDEIWRDQHEYNLLSWRLCDFCGIHILLMDNGLAIHMLTEKKYPLSQEMLSKMLSKRLEVDHENSQAFELLRFIRAQNLGIHWVPIPITAPDSLRSINALKRLCLQLLMEMICRRMMSKQESLLIMAIPNEHQLSLTKSLHVKVFEESLPSEWDTHVVVWMVRKPDLKSMGFGIDLYTILKIVEPMYAGGNSKVNTASAETSTASFSDATAYAFLSSQPQGSQLVHEDLEQIHDDDLEEMDLKWNMALLSMRARKFYQRTGRKIIIDGNSTAGYDKSKVECFNCHKMGHFARECRVPRSKDNRSWNQGNSSKTVRIEDASEKAMCAIDVKLDDTAFKASTYKRGLSILEAQVVKYKESEVLFSEEIALLKRSVGHKDYLMGLVKTELEKVKEEKEGFEFKLAKFEKSSKDLDNLLASQVTDKNKRGFGYTAVPSPHPLILNRPTPLDLSYSGLEEFKQPEVNEYGPRDSGLKPTNVCNRESNNSKENTDDSLTQQPKTVNETSSVVSPLKVDKDWREKIF